MSSLMDKMREMKHNLNIAWEIESSILSPRLFTKKDFSYSIAMLSHLIDQFQIIDAQLSSFKTNNNNVLDYINHAVSYNKSTVSYIDHLLVIATKLMNKSKGLAYGYFEYKKDIKNFEEIQKECSKEGILLEDCFLKNYHDIMIVDKGKNVF